MTTPDIRRAAAIVFGGAVVAASVIAVAIGMASLADENMQECGLMTCVDHSSNGTPKDQPEVDRPDDLPPCLTEDSPNCHWNASEQGNGDGHDVTNPPEELP